MKIKRILTSILMALLGLNVSHTAYADEDDVEVITVSAARIEKPVTAIPNTVTVIDLEQIEQATAINDSLAGVLSQLVPGFGPSLDKLAGRGESLRGRNPLYLIDGIPQHNALRDGQRDGYTIDMDFVERIEVIHGSNAIQGIGATGGVINIVTKGNSRGEGLSQSVKATLSTDDDFSSDGRSKKLSYTVSGNWGDLRSTLGLSYHDRGLFYDGNDNPVGLYPTQGDIMDSEATDVFFKANYDTGAHRLQLMLNDFSIERNGDYVVVLGDREAGIPTGTVKGDPGPVVGDPAETNATNASLDYTYKGLMSWDLNAQLYYQDFEALFEGGEFGGFFRLTPEGEPVLDQSQIESEKLGLKLLASRDNFWQNKMTLAVGLDLTQDESAQTLAQTGRFWVPEAELSSTSPFVQADIKLVDNVLLSFGVRYENAELEVDDYTTIAAANSTFVSGGNPDFDEVLPNVGVVFDINKLWSVYASYSEGFTMPDVGRVLRGINQPGQDVDDFLDLTPVITENLEFGVRLTLRDISFDVAYYRSDSDLGARLNSNDVGIFTVEREKTEISGIDASADWVISDAAALSLIYSYIEGEFDSDNDGSVDTDLDGTNIAPNKLAVFLDVDITDSIATRISVSHLFSRNFKGPGIAENRLGQIDFDDNYTLVDANANWDHWSGVWSLGIRNLLDKQYLTYFAQVDPAQRSDTIFAGVGRTLTLSYSKDF